MDCSILRIWGYVFFQTSWEKNPYLSVYFIFLCLWILITVHACTNPKVCFLKKYFSVIVPEISTYVYKTSISSILYSVFYTFYP